MRSDGDVARCNNENDCSQGELIQFPGPFRKIIGKNWILIEFILPEPEKEVDEVECRYKNHIT